MANTQAPAQPTTVDEAKAQFLAGDLTADEYADAVARIATQRDVTPLTYAIRHVAKGEYAGFEGTGNMVSQPRVEIRLMRGTAKVKDFAVQTQWLTALRDALNEAGA